MTSAFHHRRARALTTVGTLGLAAAFALTSCSGGAAPTTGGSGGGGDTATVDTVRVAMSTDAGRNYNPIPASNQFIGYYLIPVFDSLFGLDDAGELVPALAESHEYSEDGLTLTIELRDDVVFHDGEPFDAEAVKTFIDKALTSDTSTLKVDLGSVESVEAVAEHTVAFHLSSPDGALPFILAGRAGMIISPAAIDNPDLDRFPVGTGPYKMTEHQPGDSVKLERFDDYYAFDEARAEIIEMTIELDPEARLRGIQSGQIDVASLGPAQIPQAESSGVTVDVLETGKNTIFAYLNKGDGSPLADQKVRNAISHAIDREGIAAAVWGGYCEPTSHPFVEGTWYASPNRPAESATYDPELAKELLAEAGYADGLDLTWTAITAAPYSTTAEALSGQLAEVGVNLSLTISEPTQVVTGFTQQNQFQVYSSAWPGSADPSGNVNSLLMPGGLMNPGGYESPEVTALAAEGRAELDQSARADIYHQIDDLVAEQSLQIPICVAPHTMAVADHVTGVNAKSNGWLDFSNLRVEE